MTSLAMETGRDVSWRTKQGGMEPFISDDGLTEFLLGMNDTVAMSEPATGQEALDDIKIESEYNEDG